MRSKRTFGAIAVASGSPSFFMLRGEGTSLVVTRAACGPDAATPIATLADPSGALAPAGYLWPYPASPDGAIDYVVAGAGSLVRLTTSGTPSARTILSGTDLEARFPVTTAIPGTPPDPSLLAGPWRIVAVARTPAGALWVVATRTFANAADRSLTYLIGVGDDGATHGLRGPDPALRDVTALLHWGALDAMVIPSARIFLSPHSLVPGQPSVLAQDVIAGAVPQHTAYVLGVLPLSGAGAPFTDVIPAWPSTSGLAGADPLTGLADIFPGAGGELWLASPGASVSAASIGVDPDVADFDRDGVYAAQERALGLSDLDRDTDDDGSDDGAERSQGKDPSDARDGPATPAWDRPFAPSTMVVEARPYQPKGDNEDYSDYDAGLASEVSPGIVCWYTGVGYLTATPERACIDRDGAVPPAIEYFPLDDDPRSWYFGFGHSGSRLELGEHQDFPMLARHVGDTLDYPIDFGRPDCPIVRDAAELARCGDPDLRLPDMAHRELWNFSFIGWDEAREAHLVMASYLPTTALIAARRIVLAVGERFVERLGDLTTEPGLRGAPILSAISLPSGDGFLVQTAFGKYVADRALRPTALAWLTLGRLGGGFFRNGFAYQAQHAEWIDNVVAGMECLGSAGGTQVCQEASGAGGTGGTFTSLLSTMFAAELVPIPRAPESGELIFFGRPRTLGSDVAPIVRDDRDISSGADGRWALWRMSRTGGVTIWLDEHDLRAVVAGTPAGESIAAEPLERIEGMGVSSDGTRLCLAEPDPGRLWELTLGPGRPDGLGAVALVASEPGIVACGYAGAELGWLVAGAGDAALVTARARTHVAGRKRPIALARAVDRWIVTDHDATAACVADDGAIADTGIGLLGVAPAALAGMSELVGGIEHGDRLTGGRASVWRADDLCAGRGTAQREELHDPLYPVWYRAYRRLLTYVLPIDLERVYLAFRPSGHLFFAVQDRYPDGGDGFTFDRFAGRFASYLFRVRPSYHPTDWTGRVAALDPLRIEEVHTFWASTDVGEVGGMATLPGAPADADWGELPGRLGPVWTQPEAPAEPDPEPVAEPEPKRRSDEGCRSGLSLGGFVAAFAVCLERVRARRRRGSCPR